VTATRRWAVAAVAVAAVAAAVAVHNRKPPAAPVPAYPTSTATVDRRSLVSQTRVAATWGYAGEYTVVNQAPGTITMLPQAGRVMRQGQVLYRVSGRPVVLLYGPVPLYRTLAYGMSGPDVAELNTALVKLGYGRTRTRHYFGLETARAVERLQHHLGVSRTGVLAPGDAVVLPRAARVTARQGVLGAPARPGTTLLTASSTTPMVTVDLDAAQQTQVTAGDKVTITLPAGQTTPGVVSSVGHVATKPAPGGTSTITVRVTPTDPGRVALDRAPVQVSIVTGRVRDALVVPVGALLAQTGGGYAVEVTGPRSNHLVAVTPGLFDDADGLVEVTGAGLAAGQRVVVPTA
jgi:peptidoglycan hydrolase-like protein with peptidoglycan-binding domain